MAGKYKMLGTPFKIGTLEIKNRFGMAPMGGGQHFHPTGGYKPEAIEYYVARAKGGFGFLYTGALGTDFTVDPYEALGPSVEKDKAAFIMTATELNERLAAYNCKMIAQVSMGLGRNYPGLYAPSKDPVWGTTDMYSPELSKDQIKSKIDSVVSAAKVAKESGFEACEVHAIHWGYLLDQFAMSMMNKREDEYGGELENRLRAAREILEGIKQVNGQDYPVSIRFGLKTFIKDWNQATLDGSEEAGRTIEEGLRIAKLLEKYGFDALSVDTGTYDSFYYACPPMYMPKGFFNEFAAKAKAEVDIPILAAGRMNDWDLDEKGIEEGMFDAIVLARAALADPDLPNKILSGHPEDVRPCLACNMGCLLRLSNGTQPSCAVNPTAMRETRFALKPAVEKKRIVIIGGGPAGMEAARTAARRGHTVDIFEEGDRLGGALIPAGAHPFKKEVHLLRDWYERQLEKLPVTVHLNTKATAEAVNALEPDILIEALGGAPIQLDVPGAERAIGGIEAISVEPESIGQKVVVVGGGLVGCETALEFARQGKEVTIVEMLPDILSSGAPVPVPNSQMLRDLLTRHNVAVHTGSQLERIEDGKAVIKSSDGEKEIPADTVVIDVGFRPLPSMRDQVRDETVVYSIGDENHVSSILNAIWQGYELGNNL